MRLKLLLSQPLFLSMVRSFVAANGALLSDMWTFAHRFVDMADDSELIDFEISRVIFTTTRLPMGASLSGVKLMMPAAKFFLFQYIVQLDCTDNFQYLIFEKGVGVTSGLSEDTFAPFPKNLLKILGSIFPIGRD
jgi:hypothetical protein